MRFILLTFVFVFSGAVFAQKLSVGDQAPPLSVDHWLKGEPVQQLERGKVYVVEFWSTWCGPCIAGIPHLSELQEKYGERVTFISVAARENKPTREEKLAVLNEFMAGKGQEMHFRVAFDGEGSMLENWSKASGITWIPSAYVVSGDGRIAYIGHPMMPAFEKTIEEVLAGTFDYTAAREAFEKERNEREKREQLDGLIQKAIEKKKFALAHRLIDGALEKSPDNISYLLNRLEVFMLTDDPGKLELAGRLIKQSWDQLYYMIMLTEALFSPEVAVNRDYPAEFAPPFIARVEELVKELDKEEGKDATTWRHWANAELAHYYDWIGDKAKTVQLLKDSDEKFLSERQKSLLQEARKPGGPQVICEDGVCRIVEPKPDCTDDLES